MKKVVLITEPLPLVEEEKEVLKKYAEVRMAKGTSENVLIQEVRDVNVIMVAYAKITRKVIEAASSLKGIVRYGIGIDNIDLRAATEHGVYVANVPDYCIGTVADYTMCLILALARKVFHVDRRMRAASWGIWTSQPGSVRGVDLEGKVLGLIGFGKIGRAVSCRARAFGMRVIAYDPYVDRSIADGLGVQLVDLETLLRGSDFISIHTPLNEETRHMMGERELRMMKRTAYIVNTARGAIIDERALVRALGEGWVAGAALDVYENEPPNPDSPLLKLDNVILSPHIAWYTEEAVRRLETAAVEEAIRILTGQAPKNLVNRELLTKRCC